MDLFRKLFGKKKETTVKKDRPVEFRKGEPVEIQKIKDVRKIWEGKVFNTGDDDFAVHSPILMREYPFPFQEKDSVLLTAVREGRNKEFNCVLKEIDWKSKPSLVVFNYPEPEEPQKKEKTDKKYIQLEVDLPGKARVDLAGEPWADVRIKEFGVHGISFISEERHSIGREIIVKLLSMEFKMEMKGKVIRVVRQENHSGKGLDKFEIGMEFRELGETGKMAITNYAYKLQRRIDGF